MTYKLSGKTRSGLPIRVRGRPSRSRGSPVWRARLAFRLSLVLAPAVLPISCARVERREAAGPVTIETTLSAATGPIRAAVERLVRSQASGGRYRRFSVVGSGDDYFPAEFQLSHYRKSSSLERYLAIPPGRRKDDLYLYDFSDADDPRAYWHSEYLRNGRPVAFRCDFLIHVEPAGQDSTRIEIFEYVPRVWLGKKFAWGPHGPGFYLNVEEVEPTTRDRVELLDALRGELTWHEGAGFLTPPRDGRIGSTESVPRTIG